MSYILAIQVVTMFLASTVMVNSQPMTGSEEMVTRLIPVRLLESFCKDINVGPNALIDDDPVFTNSPESLLGEKRRAEPSVFLEELGHFLTDEDFDDQSFELAMESLRKQLLEIEDYAEVHQQNFVIEELIESCRDLFDSMEQAVHNIKSYSIRGSFFDGFMFKMIKFNVLAVALQTPLFEEDTDPEEYKRLFVKLHCGIFLIEDQYKMWSEILDYDDPGFTLRVSQAKHASAPLGLKDNNEPHWEMCPAHDLPTGPMASDSSFLKRVSSEAFNKFRKSHGL